MLTVALRGGSGSRSVGLALAAVVTGGLAVVAPSPCDTESAYYCIAVRPDPADPDGRYLILDRLTHAHVDMADPATIRFGYVQRFDDASRAYLDALERRSTSSTSSTSCWAAAPVSAPWLQLSSRASAMSARTPTATMSAPRTSSMRRSLAWRRSRSAPDTTESFAVG